MGADIKGILFDKDGTLLDFHATWNPVNWAAALVVARNDPDLADLLMAVGGYDAATDRMRAGGLLAQETTHEIAVQWHKHVPGWIFDDLYKTIYRIYESAEPIPVPGLVETLTHYSEEACPMGIVTSDAESPAKSQMQALGLSDHFDFIAGYDSGYSAKPDPAAVLAFCKQTNLAPENIAFVGDNAHDMETGRRAGVGLVIGVLTGTSGRDDLAPLADHVFESICDLPTVI